MSDLDLEELLDRAASFLVALTDPDLRAALEPHGLTEDELTRGWRLFEATLKVHDSAPWRPAEPELLDHIRQISDRWYPIAAGPLAERYPEIAHFLLRRSKGADPLRALCAFVHRLDVLIHDSDPFGSDGPRARDLLEQEGITEKEARRLKALIQPHLPPPLTEDELRESERRLREAFEPLWRWYSKWWSVADPVAAACRSRARPARTASTSASHS